MDTFDTQKINDLMKGDQFDLAAGTINERYRAASAEILSVFEDFLAVLTSPTLLGDLKNLRHLAKLGDPSPRTMLRRFLAGPKVQNCLTAVLRSLEENVPLSVRMGFSRIPEHFPETEFYQIYRADVINYEPDFSRLTEARLVRLLSSPPNVIDLSLLDADSLKKREEILQSYRDESLEPVRRSFFETLGKCGEFFVVLEEYTSNFRKFFDRFRDRGFFTDDGTFAEWMSLGGGHFHLEMTKSSLMLPISPQALYWGMQKEYPATLARLRELKAMVTPDFVISDPEHFDGSWKTAIECRNPEALESPTFFIEILHRYNTANLAAGEHVRAQLVPLEENRRYLYTLEHPPGGSPATLAVRITCEARFFAQPFVLEKTLQIS